MAAIRDRTKASTYVYEFEESEPLSVAQQHVRQLLRKQLATRTDSMHDALVQRREFAPAVQFRPLASEVKGLHSLQHYQTKEEEHSRIDELRELGLTDEEIELKLSCEGSSGLCPGLAKKTKVGVEPAAQAERLKALEKKISLREELLNAPLKFKGAHQMSRHAMEVENSLFQHHGNPLTHLTVEDRSHHVSYPSKVIPNTKPSTSSPSLTESGKDPPIEGANDATDHSLCGDGPSLQIERVDGMDVPALPLEIIERNRQSEAELKAMPRFLGYSPGNPSKVLYLKNLHPSVSSEDLQAVFGHLRGAHSPPHIRVLKGRMRGQAFVEFDSVDGASAGIKSVNGFVMRGKPVVITYGHAKNGSALKE